MTATLKQRVEILEQKVLELSATRDHSNDAKVKDNDWHRMIGMSAHDDGFDGMIELGKKARAQANAVKPRIKNVRT